MYILVKRISTLHQGMRLLVFGFLSCCNSAVSYQLVVQGLLAVFVCSLDLCTINVAINKLCACHHIIAQLKGGSAGAKDSSSSSSSTPLYRCGDMTRQHLETRQSAMLVGVPPIHAALAEQYNASAGT
jgi:hypothetical protein